MDREGIELVIEVLKKRSIQTLDLTGGAPEINKYFKHLVTTARKLGIRVIDRCNLTILSEPGHEDLARFLADNQVEVVASLPCYTEDNVDEQRGNGVFNASINGLQQLNALGYGKPGTGLSLNLVYNPTGPFLPPAQDQLELDYKKHLAVNFNIEFNNLFTITNMPIFMIATLTRCFHYQLKKPASYIYAIYWKPISVTIRFVSLNTATVVQQDKAAAAAGHSTNQRC